ncbi:hypothetical protein [Lyngbya confervoides]|uniref:Glycosyl-4,4'-diaponeurosporenoate acyltransferase n=1 Tax=Lyngbya confervoides BDU141951 TaxID=1574623 RepID=A0ABD4T205_9CYAN|nr:hypothetical protein [Lyngbya confervoides]MCM1982564.1 hypothetical protein [Lyngbya confervoides BDU141951]
MNTSELRSDCLIVGFQALLWLTLLFLSCFGYDWINFSLLQDWTPLLILLLLGLAYPLGIIQQALIGNLFNHQRLKKLSQSDPEPRRSTPFDQLIYIATIHPNLAQNLQQNMARAHLTRTTAVNLVLVSLVGLIFYLTQVGFTWRGFTFGAFGCLVVALASYRAQVSSTHDNLAQIRRVYAVLKSAKVTS